MVAEEESMSAGITRQSSRSIGFECGGRGRVGVGDEMEEREGGRNKRLVICLELDPNRPYLSPPPLVNFSCFMPNRLV